MQPIDPVTVLKDAPRGERLALSFARNRILDHSPNLSEAHQTTLELGENQPAVTKVPPPHALVP